MLNLLIPFIVFFIITFFVIKYDIHYYLMHQHSPYIAEESFSTNNEFEILRQSKFRNFLSYCLGASAAFKTGNYFFDSKFFISSDYKSTSKAIASSTEIQDLISIIFSYNSVHSIIVKDYSINIKLKIKSNKKHNGTTHKVAPILRKIKPLLEKELLLYNKNDFNEDNQIANEKSIFIRRLEVDYICFLISSVAQYIYTNVANKDTVMLIDSFSFLRIFTWSFFLFICIFFYSWLKLFGTVRIHLLYWKSIFLLFPACFIFSYHMLYSTNLLFDKSEEEYFQVHHSVSVTGGKSRKYYYTFNNYPDKNSELKKAEISSSTYYRLRQKNQSKITVHEGWLNIKYITKIE